MSLYLVSMLVSFSHASWVYIYIFIQVLAMATNAVKEGDSYRINGSKMWITNGCVDDKELGDIFLVYAKTAEKGWSLFLIEKGTPGFSLVNPPSVCRVCECIVIRAYKPI